MCLARRERSIYMFLFPHSKINQGKMNFSAFSSRRGFKVFKIDLFLFRFFVAFSNFYFSSALRKVILQVMANKQPIYATTELLRLSLPDFISTYPSLPPSTPVILTGLLQHNSQVSFLFILSVRLASSSSSLLPIL
jgi:hypothetical protein